MQGTIARDEIIFLSDALYSDLSNNVKAGGKNVSFCVFFCGCGAPWLGVELQCWWGGGDSGVGLVIGD